MRIASQTADCYFLSTPLDITVISRREIKCCARQQFARRTCESAESGFPASAVGIVAAVHGNVNDRGGTGISSPPGISVMSLQAEILVFRSAEYRFVFAAENQVGRIVVINTRGRLERIRRVCNRTPSGEVTVI